MAAEIIILCSTVVQAKIKYWSKIRVTIEQLVHRQNCIRLWFVWCYFQTIVRCHRRQLVATDGLDTWTFYVFEIVPAALDIGSRMQQLTFGRSGCKGNETFGHQSLDRKDRNFQRPCPLYSREVVLVSSTKAVLFAYLYRTSILGKSIWTSSSFSTINGSKLYASCPSEKHLQTRINNRRSPCFVIFE